MNIQSKVDAAVSAVCPILGISFGRITDKATWEISFKPEATAKERAAAQAAIDAFDIAAALSAIEADAQRAAEMDQVIGEDAQVAALKRMTNAEFDAWWTANVTNAAQTIAILKRLARAIIRRVL